MTGYRTTSEKTLFRFGKTYHGRSFKTKLSAKVLILWYYSFGNIERTDSRSAETLPIPGHNCQDNAIIAAKLVPWFCFISSIHPLLFPRMEQALLPVDEFRRARDFQETKAAGRRRYNGSQGFLLKYLRFPKKRPRFVRPLRLPDICNIVGSKAWAAVLWNRLLGNFNAAQPVGERYGPARKDRHDIVARMGPGSIRSRQGRRQAGAADTRRYMVPLVPRNGSDLLFRRKGNRPG